MNKKKKTDSLIEKAIKTLEEEPDEISAFSNYVAAELRSFPDQVRYKVKRRIEIAIMKGQDEVHTGGATASLSTGTSTSKLRSRESYLAYLHDQSDSD